MADKQNAPRLSRRASMGAAKSTRCRTVETVDADMVIDPCDQCRDCGQRGSWEVDHWTICPVRIDALRRELAEALAGGGEDV